jgi:mono/diheme cytochrome c family protein
MTIILGLCGTLSLAAQPAGGRVPQFDQAAVERGKTTFFVNCGFCHGANARGGDGGPDLVRSVLVLDDEEGKQIGEFLKIGRPDKGMQAFPNLTQQQVADIATWLHSEIYLAANRRTYQIQNILVGDAKAGETFFNGAGKCNTCHSVTGDLRGIGTRYDPVSLQGRIVMPRGGRGGGGDGGGGPGQGQPQGPLPKVTVTYPSGESTSGELIRITDFDVTLRLASGALRTFSRRDDDVPKVEIKDPLQAHVDMLSKYKDADIHNLTAYLVTLK